MALLLVAGLETVGTGYAISESDARQGRSRAKLMTTDTTRGAGIGRMPQLGDGDYDDTGNWQRTKFCFVDCGQRCTCGPPGNLFYSAAHDKRLPKPAFDTGNE
jgi:hypothetical protein